MCPDTEWDIPCITERADHEEVSRQADKITVTPHLVDAFEAMPHIVWILNRYRQIIFANQATRSFLRSKGIDNLRGLRFGEVLDCKHSVENMEGCGSTESCQRCGAALAIISGLEGKSDIEECRITRINGGEALDLRIHAAPILIDSERYVVVSAMDISDEKRRRALERIFFHDILNVVGTLQFISGLITEAKEEELPELGSMLNDAVAKIYEEIKSQKDLAAAENNELRIEPEKVNSLEILKETVSLYTRHRISDEQHIAIDSGSESIDFTSDRTILRRVLGNMLKNALEASDYDGKVVLGSKSGNGSVIFWVNNEGVIPKDAQAQIFQRSFSTKNEARGLGTYSMKLLTERYLKGEVSFTSSPEEGTTFFARCPISFGEARSPQAPVESVEI
ncbi:MAG: PAS domain-containing sensor histidine kinase [Dehalococcoidia bacterium]